MYVPFDTSFILIILFNYTVIAVIIIVQDYINILQKNLCNFEIGFYKSFFFQKKNSGNEKKTRRKCRSCFQDVLEFAQIRHNALRLKSFDRKGLISGVYCNQGKFSASGYGEKQTRLDIGLDVAIVILSTLFPPRATSHLSRSPEISSTDTSHECALTNKTVSAKCRRYNEHFIVSMKHRIMTIRYFR